jgi:hypothetical protein
MGASIKEKFGYRIILSKGHDGIFKVMLNNKSIFDNKNDFNNLPTKDLIIKEIERLR